ncbi:hypothetical protein IRX09_000431 [Escherichia coli]|nr:hypothetical protein [Escherichia coli]
MSVYLIDKRRRGQQIPPVGIPNHTWFCVLDIDGMDKFVDTRHYCDNRSADLQITDMAIAPVSGDVEKSAAETLYGNGGE